jgi:hypothetical protein
VRRIATLGLQPQLGIRPKRRPGIGSTDPGHIDDLQRSSLQVNPFQEVQMIRFLGMLVVLCLLFAGVGYCRGWFHAASSDANGTGTVTVTVDKDKLAQDKASVQQQVQDLGHK